MSRFYTANELQTMKRMRKEGHSIQEIAEYMGRSYMAIRATFSRLKGELDIWRDIGLERKYQNLGNMTQAKVKAAIERRYSEHAVHSVQVGEGRWEDRDRRLNEPRNITQTLMGDPPPSQSALGRPCT